MQKFLYKVLFGVAVISSVILFSFMYSREITTVSGKPTATYQLTGDFFLDYSHFALDADRMNIVPDGRSYAIMVILTNPKYLKGAMVLGHSLVRVGTKIPMVALMTNPSSDVARCLETAGWEVQLVNKIKDPGRPLLRAWSGLFTKLHIWNMTEYDRVLLLDADMLVTRNIDNLLAINTTFGAVGDINEGRFDNRFNAGLLLVKPNQTEYKHLLANMKNTRLYDVGSMEQAFLNMWFKDRWDRLSYKYNGNLAIWEKSRELWSYVDASIIHYTLTKPWQYTGNDDVFGLWSSLYNDLQSNPYTTQFCNRPI
jgi:hypothetical protein